MKKVFITIILQIVTSIIISTNIFAATINGSIKGSVYDSKSQQPIGYVNVSINKGDSGTFVTGGVTDKSGDFIIHNIPSGSYTVLISFMGYRTIRKQIEIKTDKQVINLGKIMIEEDATMLDAVQVVGMKSQMQFDIDKKVFNVDQNISSTGGSASDILKNIPSVEVDNDGEVSLRGSSAVTVWINGKASGLTSDNRAQILEQLPAQSIEKIEVITNPSAKFSPEGTAGIINIVLKKDRTQGYYGSVQTGINSQGSYNANANISANKGKFESTTSIGYRHRKNEGGSDTYRTNANNTYINNFTRSNNKGDNVFARTNVTYNATDNDHIAVGLFGMLGNRNDKDTTFYESDVVNMFNSSHRESKETSNNFGGNIELGYKHDFGENHNLDLTASYNKWMMNSTNKYYQNSYYDNYTTSSYQQQNNDINPNHWEFQADYTNQFSKNYKLEAGYKGTIAREDSPVTTYTGASETEKVLSKSLYNRFIYNQDIHALYATFSGKIKKFGYQVGLRGEYTKIDTKSLGYGQSKDDVPSYKKDYIDPFPSVFLTYQLPKDNELQFNYSRRISRPWGGQLNSFVELTDSLNISYGNPALNPEYSNAFELNYLKTWTNHLISVSAYYRTTDNVSQRISYLDGNVMNSTWKNVAHNMSSGTELVVKNSFANMIDLTTTVNLFYYQLDSFNYYIPQTEQYVSSKAESDFSWNVRLIASVVLPKGFSAQLTGQYNAKQVIAQGYRQPNFSLDLGIRKSIDKFSFSLTGRDVFNSRTFHTITSSTGYSQDSKRWRNGAQFGLTVTYSFGNMKKNNRDQKKSNETMQSGYENDMEE